MCLDDFFTCGKRRPTSYAIMTCIIAYQRWKFSGVTTLGSFTSHG